MRTQLDCLLKQLLPFHMYRPNHNVPGKLVLLGEFQYTWTIIQDLMISNCLDFIKELLVCMKWFSCDPFSLESSTLSFHLTRGFLSSRSQPIRLNYLTDFSSSGLSEHLAHIRQTFFVYYSFTNRSEHCQALVGHGELGVVLYIYTIFSQLSNAVLRVFITSSVPSLVPDIGVLSDGFWIW